MANQFLLKDVKNVLVRIEELKNLSDEELKDKCRLYTTLGENMSRDDMITTILTNILTPEEQASYNMYLRYYYFSTFREQNRGINALDESITQIEDLYKIKDASVREMSIAHDKKRETLLAMNTALPLVRLNIEYSHVDAAYKKYISFRTKTGMKQAQMNEEYDKLNGRSTVVRFLKKKSLDNLRKERDRFSLESTTKEIEEFDKYLDSLKVYANSLRMLFYQMLDHDGIRMAVRLKQDMSNDFTKEEAYKVQNRPYDRLTDEEKEAIYEEFIENAHFDPEAEVTGEVFYEAARRFVISYYDIMIGRNERRQSECISKIRNVVNDQKNIVKRLKDKEQQFDLFTEEEDRTLSLVGQGTGSVKK